MEASLGALPLLAFAIVIQLALFPNANICAIFGVIIAQSGKKSPVLSLAMAEYGGLKMRRSILFVSRVRAKLMKLTISWIDISVLTASPRSLASSGSFVIIDGVSSFVFNWFNICC